MLTSKIGLVLEGGGFRGIYSAGILDYFLENNIHFPYTIGVSMGACNGANYLSKQIGRNLAIPFNYINDKRYLSYKRLITHGELFGMNFMFDAIPNKLLPYDYETFFNSKQQFVVVCTDCDSGKPYYFCPSNKQNLNESIKASISLPFASKMVRFNQLYLLDGGIVDPIPFEKALNDGCKKMVVILTQPRGYAKNSKALGRLSKIFYNKYPELIKALQQRSEKYNESLKKLEALEADGKAFIIRPPHKIPISRVEKDKEKLKETYDLGYKQCSDFTNELNEFFYA